MHFLTAEILEIAGEQDLGKRNRITVKSIQDGINTDPLLKQYQERI